MPDNLLQIHAANEVEPGHHRVNLGHEARATLHDSSRSFPEPAISRAAGRGPGYRRAAAESAGWLPGTTAAPIVPPSPRGDARAVRARGRLRARRTRPAHHRVGPPRPG